MCSNSDRDHNLQLEKFAWSVERIQYLVKKVMCGVVLQHSVMGGIVQAPLTAIP